MAAHLINSLSVSGLGTAAASGSAYFYQPGTLTPILVYSDDATTQVISQPVKLDANGKSLSPVYVKSPARCIVQSASGATLQDIERIDGDRAELVAVSNAAWPNETSVDAVLTALGTSLGGLDGGFKPQGIGAVSRTLQSRAADLVSVKDFGAKGDGITNDTTAVQNAINAISTAGGGTLFFPSGTYILTSALSAKSGVSYTGALRSDTNFASYAGVSRLLTTANQVFTYTGTTLGRVYFRDLNIEHATAGVTAIDFPATCFGYVSMRDVAIKGFPTAVNCPTRNNDFISCVFVFTNGSTGLSVPLVYMGGDGGRVVACYWSTQRSSAGAVQLDSSAGGNLPVALVGNYFDNQSAGSPAVSYGSAGVNIISASNYYHGDNASQVLMAAGGTLNSGGDIVYSGSVGAPALLSAAGGGSVTVITGQGTERFAVTATSAGTVTVNGTTTAERAPGLFTVHCYNNSGGAVTFAFGANFRTTGAVSPANGSVTSIVFAPYPIYGASLREVSRATTTF